MAQSPASRTDGRRGDIPRRSASGVPAPGPRLREGRGAERGVLRLVVVDENMASVLSLKEAASDLGVTGDITHCLDGPSFLRTWRTMTPLPDLIVVSRSAQLTKNDPLEALETELLHQPIPLLLWIQGSGPGIAESQHASWPTMPKPATAADYQRFITSLTTSILSRTQHPTALKDGRPRPIGT